ncbi:hypothetical protein AVEN_143356-1 [Araneus ventricosus]|uniref:RING-type domain-containing protein n=1 Tax=Araneus ventricosus TaxID=182803 RepID=A0A4Y2AFE8_ARAVE|nr:hypothetical protein AVEN_143356-1 [Araneus ventricosus]
MERHFFLKSISNTVREMANKRKHSPDTSGKKLAPSVRTETDQDTQSATLQDASNKGEVQPCAIAEDPPNILHEHGPVVSGEKSPPSVRVASETDTQSATLQDASNKGEVQPTRVETPYNCTICMDSTRRKKMKQLACSHSFHQLCLETWLKESKTCPYCRKATGPPRNARRPARNQTQNVELVQTLLRTNALDDETMAALLRGNFFIHDENVTIIF